MLQCRSVFVIICYLWMALENNKLFLPAAIFVEFVCEWGVVIHDSFRSIS